MAIRQPIAHKKPPGIFKRFKLRIRKGFGHSPEKQKKYKRRLKEVRQKLKEAA